MEDNSYHNTQLADKRKKIPLMFVYFQSRQYMYSELCQYIYSENNNYRKLMNHKILEIFQTMGNITNFAAVYMLVL